MSGMHTSPLPTDSPVTSCFPANTPNAAPLMVDGAKYRSQLSCCWSSVDEVVLPVSSYSSIDDASSPAASQTASCSCPLDRDKMQVERKANRKKKLAGPIHELAGRRRQQSLRCCAILRSCDTMIRYAPIRGYEKWQSFTSKTMRVFAHEKRLGMYRYVLWLKILMESRPCSLLAVGTIRTHLKMYCV
jgi:hypothetical protein